MVVGITYDLGSYIAENWEPLLKGLGRTLLVSAIAIVGAFVIGAVLGAARAHRIPVLSQIAAVYVEVVRNTPILVQIFFLYFALPQPIGPWPGVRLDAFTVAWLSVMIWGGAFNTENFRAGFEAVPTPLPRGRARARVQQARDLLQRDASDRRPDRSPIVDQHVHRGAEEHRAALRDQLRGADHRRAAGERPDARDRRDVHGARRRLPHARVVALLRHPPAREHIWHFPRSAR